MVRVTSLFVRSHTAPRPRCPFSVPPSCCPFSVPPSCVRPSSSSGSVLPGTSRPLPTRTFPLKPPQGC